ncbi:hypothetical protein C4K88_05680 [Arthrobacter pityocampae]|uniref:Uncharacterized protein n=1 Tax=Arthrobacter pityocampae TaxID=547334 RepID=A0A2S5J025_9MICC|nr:hypothetical protein [Arthrobacter pityocampae]PPB50154.1 hypothetical protein C4K88_05680 [Arthrobacter pityocampae]
MKNRAAGSAEALRDREPRAFRATAYYRRSRWRHRRERAFSYDVLRSDGTVDQDIDLVKVMYRGSAADFAVTEAGMMEHTPETGTGPWIADSYGMPVDGPDWIQFMAEEREKHARAKAVVAVRATRVTEEHRTLILRRIVPRTYLAFDVRYADGTVRHDVNLDAELKGARYPADLQATERGARAAIGVWADYPYGRPLRADGSPDR